jgi:integrase
MAKILTDIAIRNLQPQAKPFEVSDTHARGLRVCVFPTGHKSFIVRYRNGDGRSCKATLPQDITLAEARKRAADVWLEVTQGREVTQPKRGGDTVERWAAVFIERHAQKKRESTLRQVRHVFEDIVLPQWGALPVTDIRRRDIIDLLEDLAEDKPVMANRVQAWLSAFFNWLVEREAIEASPCVKIKRRGEEHERERVLSPDELRAVWRACDGLDDTAGACIRTMILTGMRRGAVAGMRRSEIKGEMWTIPAVRMKRTKGKNEKAHTIPLPKQVLAIVERMPRLGDGDLVFTATGRRGLEHFDRIKDAIDEHVKTSEPWVWHDIRRTVATHMQGLKIDPAVIEKIEGRSIKGVRRIYQRYDYMPEMRKALQRWADHVERLVTKSN